MVLPPESQTEYGTAVPPPTDENLVITVGTSFQNLVPNLLQNSRLLILAVDVQYELDKLVIPDDVRHRVVLLPVGNHMTVQQLVAKSGTEAQQEAVRNLPPISASDGLAQVPCGGVAAVRELLARQNVQQWLEDIVPQLIQQSNGNVPQVRIRIKAGTAGGMASQGAIIFVGALLTILQDSGISSVDIVIDLIGGISFAGRRFSRTQQNSACSLVAWLKQIRAESAISVTYQLSVFEVQPVGDDRTLRNRFIADQQSSFDSPDVQNHIRQIRSNHAADGEIGNVMKVETRNHKPVSDEQIKNDIATEYLPEVESLLETAPAFAQVTRLRFDYEDSRQQPKPADDLIDQLLEVARDSGEEDALFDLIDPGSSFVSVELETEFLNGSCLPLNRLTEHFSGTPATPGAFRQQLGLVMAIHERCSDELQEAEELSDELTLSLDDAIQDFRKTLRRAAFPRRFSWKGEQRRLDDLCNTIDHYRDCVSTLRDVLAEIQLLDSAVQETQQLIDQDFDRVSFLMGQLKRNVNFTEHVSRKPMATAKPLEQTFRDLFAASLNRAGRSSVLGQALRHSVATVNPRGLQSIVDAADASVDSIVAAVQSGRNATDGPAWGGQPTHADSIHFIVYPFVTAVHQNLLKTLHREAGTGVHVAFARPTAASLNVVHLKLTFCRQLSDLLTDYYQSGIRKVVDDPASAMFLEDKSILSDIGIEFE